MLVNMTADPVAGAVNVAVFATELITIVALIAEAVFVSSVPIHASVQVLAPAVEASATVIVAPAVTFTPSVVDEPFTLQIGDAINF